MDMRFWIMTGDKKETVLEIARLASLYDQSCTDVVDIEGTTPEEIMSNLKETHGMYPFEGRELMLMLDGKVLNEIVTHSHLDDVFYKLILKASTVVCSKVTPKKKALAVSLLKKKSK